MSDSVRPYRRKPTRLPGPWNSPGKNTGVGCHFLLQCMKVKSEREVAQSCPTLSETMDCSLPGSSVHGIFQARVLEWVAIHITISNWLNGHGLQQVLGVGDGQEGLACCSPWVRKGWDMNEQLNWTGWSLLSCLGLDSIFIRLFNLKCISFPQHGRQFPLFYDGWGI